MWKTFCQSNIRCQKFFNIKAFKLLNKVKLFYSQTLVVGHVYKEMKFGNRIWVLHMVRRSEVKFCKNAYYMPLLVRVLLLIYNYKILRSQEVFFLSTY